MKVQVFQHVPFEDLGSIRSWLDERGAEIRYTRFFASDPLPRIDEIDLLIAMGGPMSVNDDVAFPWLPLEKQAVRDAGARDIPILGVCLGAQLIASAFGARVFPNAEREIGWFPVQAVDGPHASFRFPGESTVFHWHGETFDLPEGAVWLAKSQGCRNQAFQLRDNILGLQFHLEATPEGVAGMLEHGRHELTAGRYVQTEDALRSVPVSHYQAANALMSDVLARLLPTVER